MRLNRHSRGIEFSSDGGRMWGPLSDEAFEAALNSWQTNKEGIYLRLESGNVVRSPYVARFCYRVGEPAQRVLAL